MAVTASNEVKEKTASNEAVMGKVAEGWSKQAEDLHNFGKVLPSHNQNSEWEKGNNFGTKTIYSGGHLITGDGPLHADGSIVSQPKDSWEKELDRDFKFDGVIYKGQRHWKEGVKQNLVRHFIRTLLTQARASFKDEVMKWVEVLKREYKFDKGYADYGSSHENICHDDGYSAALSDLAEFIRQLDKK